MLRGELLLPPPSACRRRLLLCHALSASAASLDPTESVTHAAPESPPLVNSALPAVPQAVSPLLCFRDPFWEHEAAAVACLQLKYARNDWRIPVTGG